MFSSDIGTTEEHLAARLQLLQVEKELTRQSDEVARQRRERLPWVPVDKAYVFDTADGERTLRELFDGRSQLLVYHFMFGPEWDAGCPACSLWADGFDRVFVHLNHRVTTVCASRAPLERLESFKQRMGWTFRWVSSLRNDFNYDYGASFPEERRPAGGKNNFTQEPTGEEHAGLSAFALRDGIVHHTYSCYGRGLEAFNTGYQLLDRAPKGRDEDGLPFKIAWLRRRDEYERAS